MVTFGMAITIPEDELDLAHELANVAYLNLGLTNDLYSYQKEYETAMAMGQDYVVNVIWVLMEEHGISEDEAKAMCREKIKQTIVDFRQIVSQTNARDDVSTETKRYIEGLLYSLSGNLVWSIDCPRYHSWSSYNERQLRYMKDGIPKTDSDNSSMNGHAPTQEDGSRKRVQADGAAANGGVFLASQSPLTNGSTPSRNGTTNTNIVNVFAKQGINELKAMRIVDEAITLCAEGQHPPNGTHKDGMLPESIADLDTKVEHILSSSLDEHC